MQIVLPPEVDIFVQRQLSTGKYQNVTEVLLAAVTLLQAQEDIYGGSIQQDIEILRVVSGYQDLPELFKDS